MTTTVAMEELIVSTNNLTVLILAAGYGRRMGPFSRMVNKALIPYNNKPLISHIMDKFDAGTKFVVACGHKGQQVQDYLRKVHADKNIVCVNIPDYSEGNTGPATTIQHCKDHIRGGFLWLSCDTLFDFNYKDRLDHNWIGVYPVDSNIAQDYCWVERDGDDITRVENKKTSKRAVDAFIGMMYCRDDEYLDNLINHRAKETYEGFDGLKLKAHTVKEWLDFGTYEKWEALSARYTDISFPKPDELFYLDNNKVIKFWTDTDACEKRWMRALFNQPATPTNVTTAGSFLVHDFAPGDIIYNQLTPELFDRMLKWCDEVLWLPVDSDYTVSNKCDKFYRIKTQERVAQFRVKYADWSESNLVNGRPVKSIVEYLNVIDWNLMADEHQWGYIHGDLHFDNTIYDPETDKFTAIDWRTDFAGEMFGDVYYDMAKMLGGIWLNYSLIKKNDYTYHEEDGQVYISIPSVPNALIYEEQLKALAAKRGMNWRKVQQLVPIIYLNMSPLHEAPFDKFLIALAQQQFSRVLP